MFKIIVQHKYLITLKLFHYDSTLIFLFCNYFIEYIE